MSENSNSWFHCGRCGSLFLSSIEDKEGRLCTECGRNPSLGIETPLAEPRNPLPVMAADPAQAPESTADRGRHSLRKRKNSHLMLKLALGWSVVLFLIFFGARSMWNDKPSRPDASRTEASAKNEPTEEDIAFLSEASPHCNQTLAGFLTARTPEERNQFVASPITTASRMARFYDLNPTTNIDPATLSLAKSAVLNLPTGKAVETVWNSTDGRELDAVFVKDGSEWRLDWEHFVRFSDYPWPLFLAGSGGSEGEFRLLARERLADERKNEETISIVMYAPRFGNSNETGVQSPEFLIRRDSENGKLLAAAFELEKKGERVFGVKIPSANPEGLIRVRVKVRRVEAEMERHFDLEKVVACH